MFEANAFAFRGIFGLEVEIRQSALLLVVMMVAFSAVNGGSPVAAAVIWCSLFVSAYLHELGHAWAARTQGVRVRRIVLHGGGGFCEHSATGRRQEEFIVVLGPLVSLALWAIFGLLRFGLYEQAMRDPSWAPLALQLLPWLGFFSALNLFLFFYNMVPVQPLDGGRLLHLMLLRRLPAQPAMRIAGTVGVVFCLLWIPGMIWLFVSTGWLLLFLPSLAQHLAMRRGELRF